MGWRSTYGYDLRILGTTKAPEIEREPLLKWYFTGFCSGVAERFIRTLKEQLVWVRTFQTVEELCIGSSLTPIGSSL